jgi:small GTP-binding protein
VGLPQLAPGVVYTLATHERVNGRTEAVLETSATKPKTPIFKVVVAGEGGVGKTSIIHRYIYDYSTTPTMTVGSEFAYQELEIKNQKVGLSIWDFGGEKRFRELIPIFCLGAHGAIVVFDLSRFSTFLQLEYWMEIICESTNGIPIVLVGAKSDLDDGPSNEEIRRFCENNGIKAFIPVCARNGENINELFEFLAERMLVATDEGRIKPAYSHRV